MNELRSVGYPAAIKNQNASEERTRQEQKQQEKKATALTVVVVVAPRTTMTMPNTVNDYADKEIGTLS